MWKFERREQKVNSKRRRMKKDGKSMSEWYRNSQLKKMSRSKEKYPIDESRN